MSKQKTNTKKYFIYLALSFAIYIVITLIVFYHRLPHIFTQYAMPDVDTDGGLWFKWYLHFINKNGLLYEVLDLAGYPFGYDISLSPISNLIYSAQVFILDFVGFSWSRLIFITNFFSLITYPLSAIGALILSYYVTKNKLASFIAGVVFSFSFYHVFMGRGQMSINHIEIIPFYFLSLLYFLDKKTRFSLILSCLIFALMFRIDAYYAFFSGVFSPIILFFYNKESIKEKIVIFLKYYLALFAILFLTNINFFLANLYLLNTSERVLTGRNSIPKNELTNILYFFSPLKINLIYSISSVAGYILYIIPSFLIIIGLIINKNKKIYLIFMLCFLLAILLSSYIQSLYWINELYFRFFGMFRGVGRIILFAYLFSGIMIAMSVSSLIDKYKKSHGKLIYLGFLLFTLLIILSGLNTDETWYKSTDMAKLAALYQPIKNNKNIKIIAAYPDNLNFGNSGFPQTYQLIGQILHEKKLANGATIGESYSASYQGKIKKIDNEKTIDYLTSYGIDTILIYNKLLDKSSEINSKLEKDERLIFLGRYKQSPDKGYVTASDLSRDISVYQIKEVVKTNKLNKPLFYVLDNSAPVTYKKIDPYKFLIDVGSLQKPTTLVYDFPYTRNLILYKGDYSKNNDLYFLSNMLLSLPEHNRVAEYKNGWQIPKGKTFQYTMYYKPRAVIYLGSLIEIAAFSGCIAYCIIYLARKKYEPK